MTIPKLRAYAFLAVILPVTFLIAASGLFFSLFDNSGKAYGVHARLWARLLLGCARTSVESEGAEHIPAGPVIFMSNHQSNFDILALLAGIPRLFNWIAKKELFEIPVFGSSMRRGGYIPLDRGDGRKALKSMDEAGEIIRQGKSVVIFPEGTRSHLGEPMLPFKRGGFLLARKAGVPVVPVTINGSGRVNPANSLLLYPGKIRITFHPPLFPSAELTKQEAEAMLTSQVRTSIALALES